MNSSDGTGLKAGVMFMSIKLGTRGSKLALAQADIAAKRLRAADSSLNIDIVKIATSGDKDQRTSLSQIGGKGVFIKELEQALLDGVIDIAVHSFKDITSDIPSDLEMCAFFTPESVCDVLVSRDNLPLDKLPMNAVIGTGSMRRRALLSRLRPDFQFSDIRGNIDTRLSKLKKGFYDGIVLSEAGLIRLGLQDKSHGVSIPQLSILLPARVIALETRKSDNRVRDLCLKAVRWLTANYFSCRTGAH